MRTRVAPLLAMLGALCLVLTVAPAQAQSRLIVYRHPHLVASLKEAHRYLKATPASFQRYAAKFGHEEDRYCHDVGYHSGIRVERYDTRGFASILAGECYDAYGVIAIHYRGHWKQIAAWNRGQDAPMCAQLRHYDVPDRVLDQQPARCAPGDDPLGDTVPYHNP